jgi:hypothetical protein
MCASTMSTLDAGLTSLAANITENVYPAICRALKVAPWQGRPRLVFAKLVNLGCALVIISAALAMASFGKGGIFKILLDILATIVPPVAVPMVLSLFVRKVAPVVPFAAIGISMVVSACIYWGAQWTFQAQVVTVMAVAFACFFAARRLCPPDEATLARENEFFTLRDRPVDFASEVGEGNDGRQLSLVGAFGLVLGVAILLLLIPPSSAGFGWEIGAVAGVTSLLGALMVWAGRARSKKC